MPISGGRRKEAIRSAVAPRRRFSPTGGADAALAPQGNQRFAGQPSAPPRAGEAGAPE